MRVGRRWAMGWFGSSLLAATLLGSALAAVPADAAVDDFIQRQGTQLRLSGDPYRFTGLNIYNANSDGRCWFEYSDEELDQALTDMGPGKEVMRAWFFQPLATTPGGVRNWTRFDRTLQVAGDHGLRVIVTLTDQWGECGSTSPSPPKDRAWYESGYRTDVAPDALVPYRDWVAEVVARYRDDPRVAFWQLINEAEVSEFVGGVQQPCPTGTNEPADILRSWAQDVGGLVKSIDQNHLVSLGTIGNGACGAQGGQYRYVHDIPQIDLCEYHDYGRPKVGIPGDQFNGLQRRLDQCGAIAKPLFVGEAGIIPTDLDGTLAARADALREKIRAQFDAGVVGFLAWAWSALGSTTDNYDIGPGDPALAVLGDHVAPTITVTTPPGNAVYRLNQSVIADYACADEPEGSGAASCSGDVPDGFRIDTSVVGSRAFTVLAVDEAGNEKTLVRPYQVIYAFTGFQKPISNTRLNVARAGRIIPVLWILRDAGGVGVSSLSSFTSLGSTPIACSGAQGPIKSYTNRAGLAYLGQGGWRYGWQTPSSYRGACHLMTVTLADGTTHSARFRFT